MSPVQAHRHRSVVGRGDPHFLAFDGSRFDFHGLHRQVYLLYSRGVAKNFDDWKTRSSDSGVGAADGDVAEVLTCKMRATKERSPTGVLKTYFQEFGLTVRSSHFDARLGAVTTRVDRVLFQMENEKMQRGLGTGSIHRKQWGVAVRLNGRRLGEDVVDMRRRAVRLHIVRGKRDGMGDGIESVKVDTRFSTFKIRGVSMKSEYRRHVDFSLVLKQQRAGEKRPVAQDFSGVLGMTVARMLGKAVHGDAFAGGEKVIEARLRRRYAVGRLFPGLDEVGAVVQADHGSDVVQRAAVLVVSPTTSHTADGKMETNGHKTPVPMMSARVWE